mmetsp:Transcript_3155/g.7928  ORF Transcript_3155/g.7928 Transcript_3155/m.7928 type:complete len:575 (+) Transcript_3155:645-2369(+)
MDLLLRPRPAMGVLPGTSEGEGENSTRTSGRWRATTSNHEASRPFSAVIVPVRMRHLITVQTADLYSPSEEDDTIETPNQVLDFPVDPALLELAKGLNATAGPRLAELNGGDGGLPYLPHVVVGGRGASADTFLDNAAYRKWQFQNLDIRSIDMESTAVAHVAYQGQKPFIIFRSLLAGGEAEAETESEQENLLGAFFGVAAANGAAVMETFIKLLSDNGTIVSNSEPADAPLEPAPAGHIPSDVFNDEELEELVGIITFYQPELDAVMSYNNDTNFTRVGPIQGRIFYVGRLEEVPVVLTLSGVGLTNAAQTTQLLISEFGVKYILGSGIGGSLSEKVFIGDVVIPDRWAQYQMSHQAREDAQGNYSLPEWANKWLVRAGGSECLVNDTLVCELANDTANYFSDFTTLIEVADPDAADDTRYLEVGGRRLFDIEVDPIMFRVAAQLTSTAPGYGSFGKFIDLNPVGRGRPEIQHGGRGLAGNSFIDNAHYRTYMHETFESDIVDMESSATAAVAHQNAIPFLIVRSASDLAGGSEDGDDKSAVSDLMEFLDVAADNSAMVIAAFLQEWRRRDD